jgi:hypothetical protein
MARNGCWGRATLYVVNAYDAEWIITDIHVYIMYVYIYTLCACVLHNVTYTYLLHPISNAQFNSHEHCFSWSLENLFDTALRPHLFAVFTCVTQSCTRSLPAGTATTIYWSFPYKISISVLFKTYQYSTQYLTQYINRFPYAISWKDQLVGRWFWQSWWLWVMAASSKGNGSGL